MTPARPPYILLLDGNAPWVRSLMAEIPGVRENQTEVHAWRVYGAAYAATQGGSRSRWAGVPAGYREETVIVPGLTRFRPLSTALLTSRIRRHIRIHGEPVAIIYTIPHYAGVAARLSGRRQAYYAFDPYTHYAGWKAGEIQALERAMLSACSMAFVVSRKLQEDFRRLTARPIIHSPNAVEAGFIAEVDACRDGDKPPSLAALPGKVVGCLGRIGLEGTDWPLISALASALPEMTFALVGPIVESRRERLAPIERVLAQGNVRWLGPCEHAQRARYLSAFDVCLAPYAVTEATHRRSPMRMYDYLCTTRPILFTPVSEALPLQAHLDVGFGVDDCGSVLRKDGGRHGVDRQARRDFIQENTWEARARTFWRNLTQETGVGGEDRIEGE